MINKKRNNKNLVRSKKGQITIFVILAIVIVAIIILVFIFWKDVKIVLGIEINPQEYIENSDIKTQIQEAKEITGRQGGSINPKNFYMYKGNNIEYLCYTNEYYKTCLNQQPLLKQHIENEIKEYVKNLVNKVMQDLKRDLERQGKQVEMSTIKFDVKIIPENIEVVIDADLSVKDEESSQTFDEFKFNIPSKYYELIMIGTSIINWEARYGDSESTIYMNYYPNIKVEKIKQGDGTTVYLLTHRNTQEKFYFASRSVAWPAGYGFGEVS